MAAQTGLKDSSRSQSCIAKRSPSSSVPPQNWPPESISVRTETGSRIATNIGFEPMWNRFGTCLTEPRPHPSPLLTAGWSNPLQRCQDARDGPAILWIMVFRHVRPKYQFHLEHRRSSRLDTSGEPAIRSIIIIPWGEEECLMRDFYSRYFLFFILFGSYK